MSSIYKKGRDGYYYYQTYIYNSETGKKDKRIFHSLSTKNISVAEQKKVELDCKYEQNTHPISSSKPNLIFRRNRKIFISILVIFLTAIFFSNFINSNPKFKKISLKQPVIVENTNVNTSAVHELLTNDIDILEKIDAKPIIVEKNQTNLIIEKEIVFESKPIIPKHKIVRIERLSGAFEQGKIFVTLDEASNDENLKLLCNKIQDDYNEFSNIIICLYANDQFGQRLAKGLETKIQTNSQRKAWLAM
ncbi:MAG: hypothetical protein HN464_10595, partial [Candidatus Marinimicrobia bacterium]|nr:hypothetical protein [Candidatus Neomarinimicrobiota bacterium]MBT3962124.1 hypothetical protein [Candidatus Neomarinimicrobiota bacterium]